MSSVQFAVSEASGLYDCCSAAHNGGGAALLHLHTWTFSAALCLVCLPSVGCCMCFRLVRGGRRTAARSTAVRWQATPHNLCCCPLVFVPAHITAASIEGRLDTPVVGVETQKATPCCLWAWVPQHLAAMWCAALTPSRPLPSQAAPPPPPQVYRQLRQPPPTLHSLKKEGYKESLTVHPEQEAESEASQSGPPTTTTEAPLVLPSHVQYLLIGAGTASHACANAIQQRDPSAKARPMAHCAHTNFITLPSLSLPFPPPPSLSPSPSPSPSPLPPPLPTDPDGW